MLLLTYELTSSQSELVTKADNAAVGKKHRLNLVFVVGNSNESGKVAYEVIEVATAEQMGLYDHAFVGKVVDSAHPLIPLNWFVLVSWRGDYATLVASETRPALGAGTASPKEDAKPKEQPQGNTKKKRQGNPNNIPPRSSAIPL